MGDIMDAFDLTILTIAVAAWVLGRYSGKHDGQSEAASGIWSWILDNPPSGGIEDEWIDGFKRHVQSRGWYDWHRL